MAKFNKLHLFWIIPISVILISILFIIGSWFYASNAPIGKAPRNLCSSKNGCIDGLFCSEICFDAHHGNCLPFGHCQFEFCAMVGGPSGDPGYRYKCEDGSFGCYGKFLNIVISEHGLSCKTQLKNGEEVEECISLEQECINAGGEVIPRSEGSGTCVYPDPDFIVSGECTYFDCGTDTCPIIS